MKNIFGYIKKYGNFTFEEEKFNDIDNLVFSAIAYVDLDQEFLSKKNRISIFEAANQYFKTHSRKQILNNILAVRQGIKVFEKIRNTRRYKDLEIYNYVYIGDLEKQFSAMCIQVKKDLIYVAYEGTDQLISGWKEDFQMSYIFPIPSQEMAIEYLNKNIKFSDKKVIVGGHSKGGNLALIAAMFSKFWIQNKIVKVYNNDGPGLRRREIQSLRYKLVSKKLVHIIPNYSFVGLLLRHGDDYKVVDSYENGFLSHDICTWKIEDKSFIEANLSFVSRTFDEATIKWLNQYDDKQRKKVVEAIFDVCERVGIDDLLDIKQSMFNSVLKIIKETQNIEDDTMNIIKDFFTFLIKYYVSDIKAKIIKEDN